MTVQRSFQVERRTAEAYQRLLDAGRAAGFEDPLFNIISAYRSDAKQEQLWKAALVRYGSESEARKWVAPPGRSAHRTGRTLDLNLGGHNASSNAAALRASAPGRWLHDNAPRFGFARYEVEPWHIEHNPNRT